jgi:hypothetical protein
VHDNQVEVQVESVDQEGQFIGLSHMDTQIISPDMSTESLELEQVGPGQFRGEFTASAQGSYLVNLRYRKPGQDRLFQKQSSVSVPFAPEFRDLTDNSALLAEVAAITGGRILTEDPNQNDLFDRAGVKIPEARIPLTEPLIKLWLLIFLLDVAVRRVAVDWVGGWRKFVRWISRQRTVQQDVTLARLRERRQRLKDQLTPQVADKLMAQRYQAPAETSESLPKAPVERDMPRHEERPEPKPVQEKAKKPAETSHIQQLLDAKRKAKQDREDGK